MRIFVTGATGYIGYAVTELAQSQGHQVHGLSRTPEGDAKLTAVGAIPVRGDLTTFDVLARESAAADAVLHLAFIHDWSSDYNKIIATDKAAVDAIGSSLRGTNKAFVISSGTGAVKPNADGSETDEESPINEDIPFKERYVSEAHALALNDHGVRVSSIRLPPLVYGQGGSGFLPWIMQKSLEAGEVVYIDKGETNTSGVYVEDAAALYLLLLNAEGGIWNGVNKDAVKIKDIAEAIGTAFGFPVRSVSKEEAVKILGPLLAMLITMENRPSNKKAVEKLGWKIKGPDMIPDISKGSYAKLAESLKAGGKTKYA